jgi:hypothetical protein
MVAKNSSITKNPPSKGRVFISQIYELVIVLADLMERALEVLHDGGGTRP